MDIPFQMSDMKRNNRQTIIFNIIQNRRTASKYDIQKESRFSMSTVITTIDELLDKKFIYQSGIGKSSGGRKPVYYSVNPQGGYFIGIEFNVEGIHASLIDLTGRAIQIYKEEIPSSKKAVSFLLERVTSISRFISDALGENKSHLLGVGVGAPGLVDRKKGEIVYYAHLPECSSIPLRSLLQEVFDCPVFVDNNVNAMAYAYKSLPEMGNLDDFLLISIRSGIRMSCVLENRVYHGFHGTAGEIGHIKVTEKGNICTCGKAGCLDAEASNQAILRKINSGLNDEYSYLQNFNDQPSQEYTLIPFIRSVQAGHPKSLELLKEVCDHISSVLAGVVNILNPKTIILSGQLTQCGKPMLDFIKDRVIEDGFPYNTDKLEITLAEARTELGALGAAVLARELTFQPIDIPGVALGRY